MLHFIINYVLIKELHFIFKFLSGALFDMSCF